MRQHAKATPGPVDPSVAAKAGSNASANMKRKNGFAASKSRTGGKATAGTKAPRHFVSLFDITPEEAASLIERTVQLKASSPGQPRTPLLQGRTLGVLFEKPSLRTRVSFETAMARLGGSSIFLRGKDVGLGVRESVADFARVISQYVDFLAIRTFSQAIIEELARYASVPVINALSDYSHPCQAMADMVTILEEGGNLTGKKIVFVGDGNNVARSLALASALLGADFVLTAPKGYEFPADFVERFEAKFPDYPLIVERNPAKAVKGADVVYSDVWASMGQEQEADERREVFAPYQVNEALFAKARPDAIFLHCLPAHRGEEVTSGVLDDPRSKVIPQAANRMHFQMALLLWLLEERGT